MIELGLFWACCLLASIGALGAALLRGMCLAGVAGLYLFLEAQYLACIQVVVYIGGILVLVLFATLFSADIMGISQRPSPWLRAAGAVGALLAAAVAWRLAQVAMRHAADLDTKRSAPGDLPDVVGGTGATLGDLLVGPWLVPFLVAGLLLTVALIGAAATVKRFRRPLRAATAQEAARA